VRAGTGGDEAALFAFEMMSMYEKFARASGWGVEVLTMMKANETGGKVGIKEAVLAIKVSCQGEG
jgi:peptide chain release factor 1